MSLAGTKLSKIKKLIAQVEKISNVEDPTLSFEFLIGSLYPEVYGNVQEAIRARAFRVILMLLLVMTGKIHKEI